MRDTLKRERFTRALAQSDLDLVVAVSPENTWYLSEAVIDTQRTLLERLALVVWPRQGEPVYIVCTNEQIQARRDSWIPDLRGYVEYKESPMAFLAQAITEKGAAQGRIGIEKRYLSAHYFEELSGLLPGARFVETAPLFDRVRAVKTPDEITRLERAALATDRAIRTAFEGARPGQMEREVGVVMTGSLIANGAEMQAFQVLAAGTNSCATHHRAGEYRLQAGDLMRTDFGGVFPGGYYSDLARTICVGRASAKQRDLYQTVWEEHERLIAMLRPGVRCEELYHSHRQAWERRGWPMLRPHIGHSLGIGLHEYPLLRPGESAPLEPGMCIAIEPNYMLPGVEKYHVEDLMLITEGAPRILSRSADWARLLTSAEN
jgi:Xaa-Pro aminopeptidase